MSAGKQVRAAREAAGIGLRELCTLLRSRRLALSPTMLSRWETGAEKCPPREEVLVAIADICRLDAVELLCLAGRIPSDVQRAMLADPSLVRLVRERATRAS